MTNLHKHDSNTFWYNRPWYCWHFIAEVFMQLLRKLCQCFRCIVFNDSKVLYLDLDRLFITTQFISFFTDAVDLHRSVYSRVVCSSRKVQLMLQWPVSIAGTAVRLDFPNLARKMNSRAIYEFSNTQELFRPIPRPQCAEWDTNGWQKQSRKNKHGNAGRRVAANRFLEK